MVDTAQALPAETNRDAQISNAALAFQAFDDPTILRPRDESGRFAKETEEETGDADEVEEETLEADVADGEETETDEADEDAQEEAAEAHPMPPSWSADEAERWAALPPETQAYLAKREGERERVVNTRLQDAANARKAAEAHIAEAQTSREQYAQLLEAVQATIAPQEPDPREYGAGTGQYDRESYDLAVMQYKQGVQLFNAAQQELQAIRQQQAAEEYQQAVARKQELEAEWWPRLVAEVPDLTEATKAEPLMRSLVEYAVGSGISPDSFAQENLVNVTSAEMLLLWKAKEYDRIKAAPKAVAKPAPRPASPVAKPGVSSPRSAQKTAQQSKAFDRLAREGTIEAGAAVWKNFI